MAQMDNTPTLPLLFTRGTHYEVGHHVGSVFQEWIKKYFNSCSLVQSHILPFYHTHKGRDIYAGYLKAAETSFPQYVTEIRGMSDGSGMPFEHLFLLNLSNEPYSMNFMVTTNELERHVNGCTSVCLNTPDVKIVAHNEDCEPMAGTFSYIISAHIVDSDAKTGTVTCEEEQFTALSYPGMLPGYTFGFNKHGLVFAVNEIEPRRVSVGSTPVSLKTRALLSTSNVDELVRIASNQGYGASAGFNVNIASLNHKEMWSLEVGPGKSESPLKLTTIAEQNDQDKPCHYYHFNHYKHLEGIELNPHLPSSYARAKRAEEIAPPRTIRDVKAVLGDTQNCKYPIFRRPHDPDHSLTACTAVFDILESSIEIYVENPNTHNAPYWKLPLTF